ncbi:TBC1 domain family member 15 [Nymphaea thermarum]|nr:TBC1 domain family member 15 [Nymphaea thermarum]
MWKSSEDADSYYEVRSGCEVPKTQFRIKTRKRTLSERAWRAAFTEEGCVRIGDTLGRIHRWGVHPSIRGEVWEFLLGCFDPNSTYEERNQIRQRRREQYAIWKEECRKMNAVIGSGRIITAPIITEDGVPIQDPIVLLEANPDKDLSTVEHDRGDVQGENDDNQEEKESAIHDDLSSNSDASGLDKMESAPMDKKEIQWKLNLHQIGLDVVRTDRTLVFYEKQENLSKLWDILAVYAWIDKDVGYCQGMSDLCSPMIVLLEDEADAFWCFERLMCRLRRNFRCTESSVGVEQQLHSLASITQVVDPKLHQHLETLGGGDYLFAFRMLMVLFRREFSFGDSLFLWEMMWALEYDPNMFSMYEEPGLTDEKSEEAKAKMKSRRQFGKFERENMRNGMKDLEPTPISVFLVASILKGNSAKLLQEARGLDDVVKILNDLTGNLDARKACSTAMKLHKSYLRKAKKSNSAPA